MADDVKNRLKLRTVRNLPVKEDQFLLLSFSETYTYYYIYNLLAWCNCSPTPAMTITGENNVAIMVYAFEKIVAFSR